MTNHSCCSLTHFPPTLILLVSLSIRSSRQPAYRAEALERESPVEYFGTPPPPPLYSLGSTKSPNYYHTPPPPILHHNREFREDGEQVQYYQTPPPPFFSLEQKTGDQVRNRDFHQPPPLPTSLAGLLSGAETPPWEKQEQEVAFSGGRGDPTQPPWENQPPHGNLGFMPDLEKVSWPPSESLYQQPAQDATRVQNPGESLQPRELEYSQYSEHGQSIEKENAAAEEAKVTPKPFKPSVRAFLPFSQRIDPESAVEPQSRSKPAKRKKLKAGSSNRRPRTHTVIGKAEARQVPQLFTKLAKPRSSSVQIVSTSGQSPISSIVNFLRQSYGNLVKPGMPRADVAAPYSGLQDDIVFALSALSSIIIGSVLALPS